MAKQKEKITLTEWVVGFCSFVPFLGLFFGLASVVLGAVRFRLGGWKLMLLGVGGVFFTVGIYFFALNLFYEGPLGKSTAFERIARENLRQTVMALEFYKQVNGRYPDQLLDAAFQPKHGFSTETYFYDSSGGLKMAGKLQPFQYQLTPDHRHYHLFGVGKDQKPDTADDVFPDLTAAETAHVGYLKK